ncbi:hypothetical protein AeMF1_019695 [Aphanomyces euteiches]|nr:hypothetical protein AeMF1_019695 [Aphanomyces euteiches]KAH9189300.1 hypothetical protein AeNC1_008725 [Aphanomyces euteiches]
MTEYAVGSIAASFGAKKKKKSKKQEAAAPAEAVPELASFFSTSSQLFGKRVEPEIRMPIAPVEPEPVDDTAAAPTPEPVVEEETPAVPKKVKKPKHKKKAAEAATNDDSQSKAATEDSKQTEDVEDAPDEKDTRTIFIGNVSLEATTADVKKHFASCGKIESVRLRSLPVAGCKVDQAGKQSLVKKVCANKKIFVEGRDSCNAYLVFVDESSIQAALKLNGSTFFNKTLRVDRKVVTMDARRSVFVGNLSFTATDDEVREHFDKALRDDADEMVVESVRIIREKTTHKGKGFGYVLFKDVSTAAKALSLNGSKMGKREIRVTVCGKRFKNTHGEKKAEAKFEGRRARPGAQLRLLKKRKGDALETPSAAKKPFPAKKPFSKDDKKTLGVKKVVVQKKKHVAAASANKFKDARKKKERTAPFEKPKKPKHAARKARQALEAALAAKKA